MDFLKDLALPQSMSHITLIYSVLVIILSVLLPYFGLLTSGSILSYFIDSRSKNKTENYNLKTALELIEKPFKNVYVPIVLGIIPFFTVTIIYAQLLQGTQSISAGLLFFAWLVFIVSIVLLYLFKFKINLKIIFDSVENKSEELAELNRFSEANSLSYKKFGLAGNILLLISLFLFSAASVDAVDVENWDRTSTIFSSLIQHEVWIRFFYFLILLFVIGGIVILYLNSFHRGKQKESRHSVHLLILRLTMIFTLLLPGIIFIDLFLQPKESLSISVFVCAVLGILILFVSAHFLYAMIKEQHLKFSRIIFYTIIAAICVFTLKDIYSLKNANAVQSVALASQFDKYRDNMKLKLGISSVVLSGEDIFIGKCSACHKFDLNFTGPAYNNVLPKYIEKKEDLVKFILSPAKIDPAFPPMPAQGLKPQEAESVADYLLTTYKSKEK